MVYNQRWSPNIPVPPPAAPNPGPNPPVSNTVKGKPLEWKGSGDFDIGQEAEGGGHSFTGGNIINVTDMTKEQLGQAAKETNYELKRLAIEKRQHEMAAKIAQDSTTVNEFADRCYEEPFLTMGEVPMFDGLTQPKYNTIESIREDTAKWLDEVKVDIVILEGLKVQIGELGGPVILSPTEPCATDTDLDKVKGKIAKIEQDVVPGIGDEVDDLKKKITDAEEHLVPTPGTPVTPEALPSPWPPEIPEKPTLEDKLYDGLDPISLLSIHRIYLLNLAKYEEEKQFIMGWCLEQIRVCLADLKAAKAPGTQEDAFKANLEGLSAGVVALETAGVFHD